MDPRNTQQLSNDEIGLEQLLLTLWKSKWLIFIITSIFCFFSLFLALNLSNEYKATAIVQPADAGGANKLSALAGQFGGLASLAGINFDGGGSTEDSIAIEVIKSWDFAEKFIKKHEMEVDLFAVENWVQSSNELVIDKDLYNLIDQKWVRKPPKNKTIAPTSWELYEEYKERIDVSKDKKTGLISISATYYSPLLAKQWVDFLVEDINLHMKSKALREANENIRYLEKQIANTQVAEIRTVFSELIQEQHKTKMLAQISDEYIFKTISPAKVPEEKVKPKRILIVILGFVLGLFLSILLVLVLYYFKGSKK